MTIAGFAPAPGTIGLSRISGLVGFGITLGQWFSGDLSKYTHAFIVVDDGWVIEAMPGGVQRNRLADHSAPIGFLPNPLTPEQRREAVRVAEGLIDTPYSFMNYAAIAALRLGLNGPGNKLCKYVADSGHLICSQLCDYVWEQVGANLFTDNRVNGLVTPGSLANWPVEHWYRSAWSS